MSRIHGWLWNIVAPQISHHGAEVPRGGPRVLSSGHEYFSAAGQAQGKQEEGRGGTILIVPLQDMLWWWWWWCVWGCSWLCSLWGWPGSGQPTRRASGRSRRWRWWVGKYQSGSWLDCKYAVQAWDDAALNITVNPMEVRGEGTNESIIRRGDEGLEVWRTEGLMGDHCSGPKESCVSPWHRPVSHLPFYIQETGECGAPRGDKALPDSDGDQDSSDDEMYAEETSDEDEEEEDEAPTRHRLEWDNDL